MKGYGPENNRGYRYVLVIIDNFSKFGWTKPLKNKNAQTIELFRKYFDKLKKKPNLIENGRGKDYYNDIFQDFLDKNNIKIFSRNTSLGAVFAERFNRTIRVLLKRPVFEKRDGIGLIFYPD